MALSDELISAFVKVTSDQTEIKQETTVYGTIVEHDGIKYVRLDGSDLLTPIDSTADAKAGERVTVLIKNHTATVTGNASSPAARTESVKEIGDQITKVEILVADKVSTEQLTAKFAEIDTLIAVKVEAEFAEVDELIAGKVEAGLAEVDELIAGQIDAELANIDELIAGKIDAKLADIEYATIGELNAATARIYTLETTYAKIADLDATYAKIADLDATYAKITDLDATYAKITDLTAVNATISALDADVGKIDKLIFGEASGDSIHTNFSNAVIAALGEAWIGTAMIGDISASKITAGDILTNKVRVKSEDGGLVISENTIQISDNDRVRVQIGLDAAGDYSFNLFDSNGDLIFREGGITAEAIKGPIIVDKMVSDGADISASKLNIDSLFEEINDSSKTIKATKIYLDDKKQTLEVAFGGLTKDLSDTKGVVSSYETSIKAINGHIESKVWETHTDSKIGKLDTKYSTVAQAIDSITATVSEHETKLDPKTGEVAAVNAKVTKLEADLSGFRTSVSETYATKSDVEDTAIGGRNLILDSACSTHTRTNTTNNWLTDPDGDLYRWSNTEYGIASLADGGKFTLSFDYNVTGITYACDAVVGLRYTSNGLYSTLSESIPLVVGDNSGHYSCTFEPTDGMMQYGTLWGIFRLGEGKNEGAVFTFTNIKFEKGDKATYWTPAPEDMDSVVGRIVQAETSIEQNTKAIELRATQKDIDDKLGGYYTIDQTDAAIAVKSTEILSTVKQTYAAKSEVATIGRNLILDSETKTHIRTNATNKWLNEENGTLYVWRNSEYCIATIADGGKFTLSFDYEVNGITTACNMVLCLRATSSNSHANLEKSISLVVGNNDGHYSCTFEPTDGMKQYGTQWIISGVGEGKNEGAVFTFTNIKFEKGDEATDWTPAPEDMTTRMLNAETAIAQNAGAIALRAAQTDLKKLENDVTTNYYTKTDADAKFTVTPESISMSVKKEIDNLHLGSVNTIRNSDDLVFENYYFTGDFVVTHDGNGNVTVACGASVTHDDNGNVVMQSATTTTHDGAGNVTTK